MAEPTKWALEWTEQVALRICKLHGDPYIYAIALALDEARRRGIGEAAKKADRCHRHGIKRELVAGIIRTLITREPTDG